MSGQALAFIEDAIRDLLMSSRSEMDVRMPDWMYKELLAEKDGEWFTTRSNRLYTTGKLIRFVNMKATKAA